MHGEPVNGRPQIELASGRVAFEAAVAMGRQINPEVAALPTAGSVYWTWATKPRAIAARGREVEER